MDPERSTVAYCVIAHVANAQLKFLLETLCGDERSKVFLHLDAKATLPEGFLAGSLDAQVQLVDRVRVNWGGFSMIRATQNLLSAAYQHSTNESFVLLSGSCFPLHAISLVNDSLLAAKRDCFALWEKVSAPDGSVRTPSTVNVEKRYFMDWEFFSPSKSRINRQLFRLFKTLNVLVPYRRRPEGLIVKGSQWFVATRSTVGNFLRADPALERFLAPTFAPDETFFQTLFWRQERSGEGLAFIAHRALVQGLHYIPYHPARRSVLSKAAERVDVRKVTSEDVLVARQSPALFIRKCSLERCKEIASLTRI